MNIFLLRHGETDWNIEGRLQGHIDIPMNANGVSQIERVAKLLVEQKINFEVIVSSPLTRAYTSAAIVAKQIGYNKGEIVVEPLLIERSFGDGEGLDVEERKLKFGDGCYNGLETVDNLCKRAEKSIRQIIDTYNNKDILVVAHGAVLKALITALTKGRIEYEEEAVNLGPSDLLKIKYFVDGIEIMKFDKENSKFIIVEY